jgi:hypothetical protein
VARRNYYAYDELDSFSHSQSEIDRLLILNQAIAQLDPTHGGEVLLNGKEAEEVGFTAWRTRIAYVQQKQIRLTAATGGSTFTSLPASHYHPQCLTFDYSQPQISLVNISIAS